MDNRLRPLGRAWGASGVAVALAAATHFLAGGHPPNAVLVAVAWAIGAVIALPFSTRKPGTLRLTGLLLPAQLIYHLAFGGHVGMDSTGAHLHGADLSAALGSSAPGAGGLASGSLALLPHTAMPVGTFMLLAHLASAVGSVAAIRHAERGLDAARYLARTLSDAVARLAPKARLPRVAGTRRRAWSVVVVTAVATTTLPSPLSRRGPPLFLAHA